MNELVPLGPKGQLSTLLPRRTEIVASTLETMEQADAMSLYRKHPELFIVDVQKNYPLSWHTIDKYEGEWNWSWISSNPNLDWQLHGSFDDAVDYSDACLKPRDWDWGLDFSCDQWDWIQLSRNESLPWSDELIEKYDRLWNWGNLSCNEAIPWTFDLIDRYIDKWSWDQLQRNKSLPWSIELLERYADRWNWNHLSARPKPPWSVQLIEKFENRWDWTELSSNHWMPWSEELLERFSDQWLWDRVAWRLPKDLFDKYYERHQSSRFFFDLPWTVEKMSKLEGRERNWTSLLYPGLTFELINKYHDRFDWGVLSNDNFVESDQWPKGMIEAMQDHWDWEALSGNDWLELDADLIAKFQHKWNFKYLSGNWNIPWSLDLIKRFESKWNIKELSIRLDLVKYALSMEQVEELLSEMRGTFAFKIGKKIDPDEESKFCFSLQ